MYEELIESSRACAMGYNGNCDRCLFCGMSNDKDGDCYQQLHKAAAAAIEEFSAYVQQLEELRKDGWYLQKTKMMTYGQATMTQPLPEPPKEE